jgi:hypothetical protein
LQEKKKRDMEKDTKRDSNQSNSQTIATMMTGLMHDTKDHLKGDS